MSARSSLAVPQGHAPEASERSKTVLCRFFASRNGCRAGRECAFVHDTASLGLNIAASSNWQGEPPMDSPSHDRSTERRQAVTKPVPASRVVSKPVSQAQTENPREFQLGQIRRRFSPKETRDSQDGAVLDFSMAPSDPDFPFEMQALQCMLTVPKTYPGMDGASRPRLRVRNQEFARGFAINIEKGFETLVEERPDSTLLAIMSALDKNLEGFLSKKQAETVKLVANADKRHLATLPSRALGEKPQPILSQKNVSSVSSAPKVIREPEIVYTKAQKTEARERREAETRQVEARLGRSLLYKKSHDGIAYTLPIEPRRRSELPKSLQALKTVQLYVPVLYPLQNCRVQLDGVVPEEALGTESAFQRRAKDMRDVNLMGHVNYLAQNMHVLAKTVPAPVSKPASVVGDQEEKKMVPEVIQASSSRNEDDDRSHIKIIPRPPEWDIIDSSDISDTDDDDLSWDSNDNSDGGVNIGPTKTGPDKNPDRGTAISFPSIELYGIELLELTSLSLTIKCTRCKLLTDIKSLTTDTPNTTSCTKCGTVLSVTYRRDFIHSHSTRAGFLDLSGCSPLDLLPSHFTPTCSTCSTPYSTPGITAVRGDATTAMCRTCHSKLTLKLTDTRFLRITSSAPAAPTSGPKRKVAALGITAGTELPSRGSCAHYRKSYRWFRFSCCEKVFPCDRCHDENEDHANEHANRMICGWCSREQNYRPEECAFCGRGVVGRKGRGFWEGGRGTRDKVRMSRKDPRKYKRIGTAVKKE